MSIWRCITPIALGLASLGIHPSHAQENFPSRPLTIINPWAAGSPTDVMARTLAEEMHKQLGQSIVVISREGGSGVIGMNVLAQSAPDGLTMAFTPMTPITIQPHYIKGLKLSPEAVQPLCGVTEKHSGRERARGQPLQNDHRASDGSPAKATQLWIAGPQLSPIPGHRPA